MAERSRVASVGRSDGGGFGLVVRRVEVGSIARARRDRAGSFDAYAMAALQTSIEQWNRTHGAPCERVGVSQGVNLRPAAWPDDVVVNLAAFTSVVTEPADRTDLDTALAAVIPQLDHDRRVEQAREIAGVARAARLVPEAVRRTAVAAASPGQFDTCVISNVGVIADVPRFADDHQPTVWVSTPAMPEVGFAIALFTIGDQLQLNVRYRREQFDASGAAAFVDGFLATLTRG